MAASRAESLAARGRGDEAIRFDLAGRGIAADTIEEALAALEAEGERVVRVVGRIGLSPRTAAQLRRKGFSEESVETALRQVPPEL